MLRDGLKEEMGFRILIWLVLKWVKIKREQKRLGGGRCEYLHKKMLGEKQWSMLKTTIHSEGMLTMFSRFYFM